MREPHGPALICPIMIGREAELAVLDRLIGGAHAGHGRTALVAGDASVGKSRLAAEVRDRAARPGFTILQGRCFEPDRVLPSRR